MAERIVVVGGGSMGAGIAAVAARAGYLVTLVEPDPGARGRASERAPDVQVLSEIPESDAALAIEAVPERLDIKLAVFTQMERRLAHAVLATNTSSLSVGEIAQSTGEPERVVGLHFFNPPEKMALVEIVRHHAASAQTIEAARAFVERIGKTGIVTADTPGFIVNRVARPFYLQAMRALDARVAEIDEMDALARGVGFRMGPFELMDMIGLDVNLATSESIYERTNLERLAPIPMQRALVEQGRLGRKSGVGFYAYDGATPHTEFRVAPRESPNEDELVAIVGAGAVAEELAFALARHFAPVERVADDEQIATLEVSPTIVIDVGDGTSDRSGTVARLDAALPAQCAIFVDAYASELDACAKRARHPERVVGYGVLGSFDNQAGIEVVDGEATSDDALALAQEMFEATGHGVALVENVAGLFLGRVIGSIVNEAVAVVGEGVASPDDVDTALRLGTNYPRGPIAWGREIGGSRIARILRRIAERDGADFAPHRALWVLDAEEEPEPLVTDTSE
jgi:3-hydroxybutyryl-CoA dehydrogenase